MEKNIIQKDTHNFDKNQYDMLMRCSKKKNISEWNEWRKKNENDIIKLNGAILNDTHLKGADLSFAHLEGANLFRARLEGVNLFHARLEGAEPAFAHLEGANLSFAHLEGANLIHARLEGANLLGTRLNGANLFDARLGGAILDGANLDGADLRSIIIEEYEGKFTSFFNTLFGNAVYSLSLNSIFDPEKVIEALSNAEVNNIRFIDPVLGRKVRDEAWLYHFKVNCEKNWYKRIGLYLWKWTCNYGRSFIRWAVISLCIAILFAVFFWIGIGPEFEQTSEAFKGQSPGFLSLLYFSIITFTTLGFGDIVAANTVARFLVTIEVILGYVMLGGLISIFANILGRRND